MMVQSSNSLTSWELGWSQRTSSTRECRSATVSTRCTTITEVAARDGEKFSTCGVYQVAFYGRIGEQRSRGGDIQRKLLFVGRTALSSLEFEDRDRPVVSNDQAIDGAAKNDAMTLFRVTHGKGHLVEAAAACEELRDVGPRTDSPPRGDGRGGGVVHIEDSSPFLRPQQVARVSNELSLIEPRGDPVRLEQPVDQDSCDNVVGLASRRRRFSAA